MAAPTLTDIENETEVAAVFVDSRGMITKVNREFEKLFGWSASVAVGSPLTIIIPPMLVNVHQGGFSRLLATNEPRLLGLPIRLPAITKSGRQFIAEHLIVGERRDGQWRFGATIREVAPR